MNKKNIVKNQENNVAALFKITARCNDCCDFCIEKRYINKDLNDLSLAEIKNNFNYLKLFF